jgi:hypothetical protein
VRIGSLAGVSIHATAAWKTGYGDVQPLGLGRGYELRPAQGRAQSPMAHWPRLPRVTFWGDLKTRILLADQTF